MNIVIVEDESRIRSGLANLIRRIDSGYKIVGEAENGYEGLQVIREAQPDLVITDVKMPKMDGFAMIKEIHAMGLNPKIVILSGYAEFEFAQRGLRLGVKDYLLKPITVDNLTNLLADMDDTRIYRNELPEMGYSEMVNAMIQHVRDYYGQRIGLDTFAERFRMTPEYISLIFARETGTTFSYYLKKVRIEKAKELLNEDNSKIFEVAYRVGYPDPKYFSKVFKDYTGVSPKQYVLHYNS